MSLHQTTNADGGGRKGLKLTSRCGGAGGSAPSGSLARDVSHSPLHGTRRLSCTVGVGSVSRPLQWFIQQERLLVDVIALAAAAVGVTGVV